METPQLFSSSLYSFLFLSIYLPFFQFSLLISQEQFLTLLEGISTNFFMFAHFLTFDLGGTSAIGDDV